MFRPVNHMQLYNTYRLSLESYLFTRRFLKGKKASESTSVQVSDVPLWVKGAASACRAGPADYVYDVSPCAILMRFYSP